MFFYAKGKILNASQSISYNSNDIEIVTAFKTLRVWFTDRILWDAHVDYASLKLARTVGLLTRWSHIFPINIKLLLFQSLFMSQLQYFPLVWGTATQTSIQKLFLLQKKCLRVVYSRPRDYPT